MSKMYSIDKKNYAVVFEQIGMVYIYDSRTERLVGSEELSVTRNKLRSTMKRGKVLSNEWKLFSMWYGNYNLC